MIAVRAEYRNSAAACRNHDMAGIYEVTDRTDLHDLLRLRAGHNAAPAAAGILDDLVISLFYKSVCLFLRQKGTDRFCRVFKSRIRRIDLNLRKAARDILENAPVVELLAQQILQIVADIALAHRCAYREWARYIFLRV